MTEASEWQIAGSRGKIVVHEWSGEQPRSVVVIVHGYGEHAGRYDHVAKALVAEGAAVYAPDHLGHGRSGGERVLIEDLEDVVTDLDEVVRKARADRPGLPVALIGHSMGGIIATRYVQRRAADPEGNQLAALVLSGPVIGGNPGFQMLLSMDPIPEVPIDPATLSRDPAVGEAYAADELVWHGAFKRETLEALFRAIDEIAAGPGFGSLPTLWIHGELDALAPMEQTRPAVERVKGDVFEERVYEGAQHEVFNETNKDEVLADVTGFLRTHLQTAAPAT